MYFVVAKQNDGDQICVNLTKLNESYCLLREICLSSVEKILAQLGGAQIFSKRDANSGFWQKQLAKESDTLPTFITFFGSSAIIVGIWCCFIFSS